MTLPGKLYRKRGRWWWQVQLPGEKSPHSRALKPEGSRRATTDRQLAHEIAFSLWQEAIRAEARAAVTAEQAVRVQRMRRHSREKMKALRDVIESAEARAETQTAEREELEIKLNGMRNQLTQMTPCECCGHPVLQSELRSIDSGQRLCRDCLADLHRAAQRPSSQQKPQDEGHRANEARPGTADQGSGRDVSLLLRCAAPVEREDSPGRRDIHESDVLYAETRGR